MVECSLGSSWGMEHGIQLILQKVGVCDGVSPVPAMARLNHPNCKYPGKRLKNITR